MRDSWVLKRPRLWFWVGLPVLLVGWAGQADAQLRVVTYNTAGGPRQPHVETIIRALGEQQLSGIAKPVDVWLFQEHDHPFGDTQQFVGLLNDIYGEGTYAHGTVAHLPIHTDIRQTIAYNTQTVELIGEMSFGNFGSAPDQQPRQTMRYRLRPVGYDGAADFFAYNSHYKAGDGTIDQQRRQAEAAAIRANADALGDGVPIIYAGDFNMQRASQEAFQTLLAPGPGQAFDPIDRIGNWHMNPDFADVHTQSPCTTGACPTGFTGGGMDDRFDLQMVTAALLDGEGLNYIAGTYDAFGNNGTTFNSNINSTTNTVEFPGVTSHSRTEILNALWNASDHLPVVADYQVPAILDAIVSAVPETLEQGEEFQLEVLVSNAADVVAAIGADTLHYSLTTTGDLAGSFLDQTAIALDDANHHPVALDTSTPGTKSGLITLETTSRMVPGGPWEIPVQFEVLAAVADLLGDFNDDGLVDAADYALWRDSIGLPGLPNDDGLGTVGQQHFQLWKENFGAAAGAGSSQTAAVPEPAGGLLLLLAGCLAPLARVRLRGWTPTH